MPIYGNGRLALDLRASTFETNDLRINGAIVNGTSLVITAPSNNKTEFDKFDDIKYKAAKYTILGKSANYTQMCEVLISVPIDNGDGPIISVYGVVTGDDSVFDYFTITAERTTDGSHDIQLFINNKSNQDFEVSALRTYII